jgi:hypothetical protein
MHAPMLLMAWRLYVKRSGNFTLLYSLYVASGGKEWFYQYLIN